ncbi:hypothetical protein [Halomicrobium salinisoli]|uniref:hypothetical protein n=1 Tax=Halomicrobium salinisoli TaxID=2878391 RepID=UPI001CF0AD15|nr:hypothetical protein [Halomicrobium salinisoli]
MSSLGQIIKDSLEEFLLSLFDPVRRFIGRNTEGLIDTVVKTPRPNAVFEQPTNGAWPDVYTYYWETIIPLALLLWSLSIGLVIFLESTSHLFSNYHRSKLKKRAFSGLIGILSWWWMAALSLRFIDGLATFIVPNLADISMFDTLSFGAIGVLGVVISLLVDLVVFLIIGVLYYMRQVMLYLFVLLMPLLIVFWIPGVGPFTLVSRFMKRLAGFYVPFLFMTVPVALLFRLGELLGSSVSLSIGGVGQWLMALVTPILAVVAPFVLFWQAGGIFFMADRMASHGSRRRARQRIDRARTAGGQTRQAAQNFGRGVRNQPARRSDGQALLNGGDSRAHRVGDRLSSASRSLRDRLRRSAPADAQSGSAGVAGNSPSGSHGWSRTGARDTGGSAGNGGESTGSSGQPSRERNFDPLRDRVNRSGQSSGTDRTGRTDNTSTNADEQSDE